MCVVFCFVLYYSLFCSLFCSAMCANQHFCNYRHLRATQLDLSVPYVVRSDNTLIACPLSRHHGARSGRALQCLENTILAGEWYNSISQILESRSGIFLSMGHLLHTSSIYKWGGITVQGYRESTVFLRQSGK
jgi:hypothetical protein